MNRYQIQKLITECISRNEIDRALTALKCIVVNNQYADDILTLQNQISRVNRENLLGLQNYETISVASNRNLSNITVKISELPEDILILKNKLNYYLNTGSNLEETIKKLKSFIHFNSPTANSISLGLLSSQQNDLENELEDDSLNKYSDSLESTINQLRQVIDDISYENLQDDFVKLFWENDLNDRAFHYIHIKGVKQNSDSPYFFDIISRKDAARSKLMMWEEHFISGDYKSAQNFIDSLRIEGGFSDQLIYEYTALNFLKTESTEKIISDIVSRNKRAKYEKLKLYVLRAQSLIGDGDSKTKKESIPYIVQQLHLGILKIYNNISFDYIIQATNSNYIRRRNIIKELILLHIELLETFKFIEVNHFATTTSLITELEGGGKFQWIKIFKNKIENKIAYNAIEDRQLLIKYLGSEYRSSELSENLYKELFIKGKSVEDEDQRRRYLHACELAYCLYKDERFHDLQKGFKKSSRPVAQYNEATNKETRSKEEDQYFEELINEIDTRNGIADLSTPSNAHSKANSNLSLDKPKGNKLLGSIKNCSFRKYFSIRYWVLYGLICLLMEIIWGIFNMC